MNDYWNTDEGKAMLRELFDAEFAKLPPLPDPDVVEYQFWKSLHESFRRLKGFKLVYPNPEAEATYE